MQAELMVQPLEADLRDLLGDRLATWSLHRDSTWLRVAPPAAPPRTQGWKLHVSATENSAREVLRRASAALFAEECPFKIAADFDVLAALNDARAPRGSSGKFMTVYPRDDVQLCRLAVALDAATTGLPGPQILSDRRLRPGSLVHLRYGTFAGSPAVSEDGEVVTLLVGPDGTAVEDRREARFTPPPWAPALPELLAPAETPAAASAVLLGGRFVVRAAIRHANKGGVFRAVDQRTGNSVVVKQARAHVGAGRGRPDVRELLRHEAALLRSLEPLRRTPRLIDRFAQGDDEFLAEEALDAVPLRSWVGLRFRDGAPVGDPAETLRTAVDIADLLAALHGSGIAVRDLSPNNVLVDATGRAWLVDLELAAGPDGPPPGEQTGTGHGAGTPAYSAPEQLAGAEPARSADLWSLGALLCLLFTGTDPYVDPATASDATAGARMERWLDAPPRRVVLPAAVAAVARRLLRDDPHGRPDAATVAGTLRALPLPAGRPGPADLVAATVDDLRARPADAQQLAADLLDGILGGVRPESAERRWPASSFGETTDPVNVQHGAAGILGALVQAAGISGDPRVTAEIARTARWIADRTRSPRPGPVGLYFGAAGPAWALSDAAAVLGDDALRTAATDLALRLPVDGPGPDLTHGRAGLGLTLLHLAEDTGDARLLERADRVADGLVREAARDAAGSVSWFTAADARSSFAGRRFHGLAHGTAGIGLFLLAHAAATGRSDCRQLAAAAVDTLLVTAEYRDGTAGWGSSPEEPDVVPPYWCNGAAGIGTFLAHAYAHSGDPRLPGVVDAAARAVMASKWRSGSAYCHGLAGNADFLLDAAAVLPGHGYRVWAADLAALLVDRAVRHQGRLALTDEPGRVTPDFNVGGAGALSFLLRLRSGGRRLWLPALTTPAVPR